MDLRNGSKNKVSGNLHDIYEMLDHGEFYRVNKNYISKYSLDNKSEMLRHK